MNTELKKRWINALRSGEYPQTCGSLAATQDPQFSTGRVQETAYCCLGVLAYTQAPEAFAYDEDEKIITFHYADETAHGMLQDSFLDEVGLEVDLALMLASFNDSRGWDFNQIADWIEEYL